MSPNDSGASEGGQKAATITQWFPSRPESPSALVIAEGLVHETRARKLTLLVVGPCLFLAVLAASFTGYLLPWDQLARFQVTVGTNVHGYTPVFGAQTRFVLIDGVEISKAVMLRWFIVHTVVMTSFIVVLGAVAIKLRSRPSRATAVNTVGL